MRYFTIFLVAIGLLVLVLVIIVKSLSGPPGKPPINLNSYASTLATAQLTIDGPVNADQTHQQVQITVGNTGNQFEILQGYQGTVQTNKTFESNTNAFSAFLQALQLADFTKGSNTQVPDEQGYCPDGDRYIFELSEGADTVERYWATSCGGQGTYGGDVEQTLDLFEKQVPDYDELVSNVIF
jgi:hypothetical protein